LSALASSDNDWKRTKLILALGADLTKKAYWSQHRRSLVLGEGQIVTGTDEWRGGSALNLAQELCRLFGENKKKENNLSTLVEYLQEEVNFFFLD